MASPESPRRPWRAPAAIFAGAFAVRLACALEAWAKVPFLKAPVVDGAEYFIRAREVAKGDWWPSRMEIHPPMYGWFAGSAFAMFGEGTFALYVLQALLGAGTAVLIWRFTKLLAGERAAAIAGAIAALAWPTVLQDVHASAAGLSIFFAAAALNLAEWASRGKAARALAPGLAVGLAGIAHGLMLAFGLVLLVPLLEKSKRGLAAAAIACAAALVPPLAVAARNSALDDGAFALQANVGLNIWIGNNDGANGYPNIPQGPAYDDVVDGAWRAGHMTAAEQDSYFRGQAVRWAASHPFRWLLLSGKRLVGTWSAAEVDSSMDAGVFGDLATSWLAIARWWLIAGLALPGGVLLWKRAGPEKRLWLAGLVAAIVPLLLLVTSNRYRVPLLVALIPAAAVALEAAWAERSRLATKAGAGLAGLAVAGAALSLANPLRVPTGAYFERDRSLGASYAELGQLPTAEAHLKDSLGKRPGDPYTLLLLGRVYAKAQRLDLAAASTLQALDARPAYVDGLVQAALFLPAVQRHAEIPPLFARGAAAAPDDPRIPGRLGEWYLAQGSLQESLAPLQRAVQLQPRSRSYRANLASAYMGLGRFAEAEPLFWSVLKDDPGHAEALFGYAMCAFEKGDLATAAKYAALAEEAGHPAAPALLEKATKRPLH